MVNSTWAAVPVEDLAMALSLESLHASWERDGLTQQLEIGDKRLQSLVRSFSAET